nr:hypothetical protein Iba_chr12aCG13320 [Ipomoea batatas]
MSLRPSTQQRSASNSSEAAMRRHSSTATSTTAEGSPVGRSNGGSHSSMAVDSVKQRQRHGSAVLPLPHGCSGTRRRISLFCAAPRSSNNDRRNLHRSSRQARSSNGRWRRRLCVAVASSEDGFDGDGDGGQAAAFDSGNAPSAFDAAAVSEQLQRSCDEKALLDGNLHDGRGTVHQQERTPAVASSSGASLLDGNSRDGGQAAAFDSGNVPSAFDAAAVSEQLQRSCDEKALLDGNLHDGRGGNGTARRFSLFRMAAAELDGGSLSSVQHPVPATTTGVTSIGLLGKQGAAMDGGGDGFA